MMVIAFLSEPFFKKNSKYETMKNSGEFIQSCFKNKKIIYVGRVPNNKILNSPSFKVDIDNFEEIYNYNSIIHFALLSIKNPFFLKKYISRCNEILNKYPNSKVWIRNPSIGCLIFSLLAIKKNRKIYNHMCANSIEAWHNDKYKSAIKVLAFLFSRLIKFMSIKVISNKNTINLCTGKVLHEFCLKHNNSSYHLIDSTIKKISTTKNLNDIFTFCFIGRVQEDKGILNLIHAFESLKFPCKLIIIGTGILYDKLKEHNKNKDIELLGAIPNKSISEILERIDVVVVPSKNEYEGFPRVILEAWATGTPVIISNSGGINSLAIDNFNALIYEKNNNEELKNKMTQIYNPKVFNNLRRGAIQMSTLSTKDYWVNKFLEII